MGITDIDDKIIKRSIESGKDFQDLSRHFETEFFADLNKLNIREPYLRCRVTDYVPQIIQFIEKLIAKDDGYVTKDGTIFFNESYKKIDLFIHKSYFIGSVYFNTNKYNKYGKLSTVPEVVKDQHSDKKSALDFALWKAAKDNEPSWKSPWGCGRPGWHIECSTIAR